MLEKYFKTALEHHTKGNWNKAKEIYEHLLKTYPNNITLLENYGTLLSQLKQYTQAKNIFEKCMKIKPHDSLLLYNFGKFFHDQEIFDKAMELYNKSFEINPKNNLSMYNIGNIHLVKEKYQEAILAFNKSVQENPKNYLAYNNLALAYKNTGNFDKALEFFRKTIKTNNDYVDGHVNYSTMLLTLNKLDEGLEQYEWRKKSKSFSDYIDYRSLNLRSKVWNGEDLNQKKLLVIAEQGIGDLIQFTRYLYFIKKKYKAKIIFKIKGKSFLHFFESKNFNVISASEVIPEHNYHIHMLSLLRIFHRENNFFVKSINFFKRKNEISYKWKEKIGNLQGLKIGINCSTSERKKNIPFKYFVELAKKFKHNFVILQKNLSSEQLKDISDNKNIIYFPELDKGNKAFIDSIDIINRLDLIITADTALAHLSATLEKKTWIAIPHIADWRWFLDEKKTKWYSNVSLYRQKKIDDWAEVFESIKESLQKEFN